MSVSLRDPRRRRQVLQPPHPPSIREVCLLGQPGPPARWTSGERLTWSGRDYQVETGGTAADARRYVFLSAVPG